MRLIRSPYLSAFSTGMLDNKQSARTASNRNVELPRDDRSLDDLAVPRRRAWRLLLPALRAPDGRRGGAGARSTGGRRGPPLLLRLGGGHGPRGRRFDGGDACLSTPA